LVKLRKYRFIIIAIAISFVIALFFANRFVVGKGYSGIFSFLSLTIENYSRASKPTMNLEIMISDSAMKKIEIARENAMKLGVIVPDTDAYVPCKIIVDGVTLKAELRLKGKMLDHVEGDKWSFRIKVKDKGLVWGMKKFSIQHPGTRNYLYDWVYHQLSKQEGIVALNYFFIGVKINGEEKGVYALEENFSEELLIHNKRQIGPLFRFNPDLYWEFRVNELKGVLLNDEQTKFQSSDIDFYSREDLLSGKSSKKYLYEAMVLMENFRQGKCKANQALDIKKFAMRHAILDLVGGHHSVDWSDVKFYYNPSSKKIEPVSYESFSAYPIDALIGEYRCVKQSNYLEDFHDALFSDEDFFKEYVTCLNKISSPEFVNTFFTELDASLQTNKNILNYEYPYKKFDASVYNINAKRIQSILAPRQMILAYPESKGHIKIAGISSLPVLIKECILNDSIRFPVIGKSFVYAKTKNSYPVYESYHFNGLDSINYNSKVHNIKIVYSIPGNDKLVYTKLHSEKFPELNLIEKNITTKPANVFSFENLFVDLGSKSVYVKGNSLSLNRDLVLPDSFSLVLRQGQEIIFSNNAGICLRGALIAIGNQEYPLVFRCSDSSNSKLIILNSHKISNLKNVVFSGFRATKGKDVFSYKSLLNVYKSTINLSNINFTNCNIDLIELSESQLTFKDSYLSLHHENVLNAHSSRVELFNVNFKNIRNDAFKVYNADLSVNACSFNNCAGTLFDFTDFSNGFITACEFNVINTMVKAGKGSSLAVRGSKGSGINKLIKIKSNRSYNKDASINFLRCEFSGVEQWSDADSKELIIYNNKPISDQVK
jgi:hypothetical protein